MRIDRGIIVSIQGYSRETTNELAIEAIAAGAVAIRTDKKIDVDRKVPVIGLHKIKVEDMAKEAYITPTIADVRAVLRWADMVAVDCRKLNPNLNDISDYCHANNVQVVADIASIEDWENLHEKEIDFEYLTTALTVFRKRHWPDKRLARKLARIEPGKVIAEGNYRTRADVEEVFDCGVSAVCIGAAISDIYKLTRKFASVLEGENDE